jgi:hypothetical protein
MQISVLGKASKLRQVLLPAGGRGARAPPDGAGPLFRGRTGERLCDRAVFGISSGPQSAPAYLQPFLCIG